MGNEIFERLVILKLKKVNFIIQKLFWLENLDIDNAMISSMV